nr:acyltransferase family protein [Lachnospiraceae bacterium]
MDNKRVIYLDVLRIIAILMMMMIHVSGGYLGGLKVCSVQWNIAEVFQSVSRCCITLFFMISGIFFLDDKKDVTLKSLFTRNIKRIVTAFLFWSLFYAVFACINEKTSDVKTLVKVFIQQTLAGHYHMWFLFTICGIYLIVPMLRKICEDKVIFKYSILVAIILTYVLPLIAQLIDPYTSFLSGYLGDIKYTFISGYVFIFMLGRLLYENEITKKKEWLVYILGIGGVITTYVTTWNYGRIYNVYAIQNSEYTDLAVVLFASAVFVFFKQHVSKLRFSDKQKKWIGVISKYSFGMYLVHDVMNFYFI